MRPCFFLHFSLVISEFICSVPATVLLFSRRNTHTWRLSCNSIAFFVYQSQYKRHQVFVEYYFHFPLRSPIETHDCNLMALMSI